MLTFEQPLLLLLLLPIALLVFLTWRRMSLPFPTRQRVLILVSRLLLFTLLVLALAGTSWVQPISRQSTIFVGDISSSTAAQRSFIENWITSALKQKRADDQVGIVAVGRNALVEQSVQTQVNFSRFESTPDTNYTDLAAGLRLAAAILPIDSQRHIVLLTDGQQNLGDAIQEAQLLRQEGIRLDIVPLPSSLSVEARIDGLSAPNQLRTNERFTLHVGIYSQVAQRATLRVYLDQGVLLQEQVSLPAGEQDINIELLAPTSGFHTFRVTLDAPQDTILQNNEATAFVNVQGPPRILVIEGKQGNGRNIVAALRATKMDVVVGAPGDVPTTLDGLAPYGAVILADVSALSLGTTRMQTLQAFVRDLGRGLIVSGGQNSYGLGNYSDTPLEQTLPVKMDIPQHKDNPDIAVVLIIESLEAPLPVNISKEAAKGVINLLTPRDQVGISAGYGSLAIPMQHVINKTAIGNAINAMDPGDPPSYNPDFVNAEQILLKTTAKIKHVIILGDGDAFDNYAPQITKMAKENITVSAVATNSANYQELGTMINIANWGKGRFYHAEDPSVIPQVLLKETERASRRTVINEAFTPAIVGTHPLLTGLQAFPQLNGYVATTPKPEAQMVLMSHRDDPVLAAWQYGLGRSVAWTSDALGLWTTDWLRWKDAPRWWANLVTWTLPTPDSALNVSTTVANGTGKLVVDLPSSAQTQVGGQQQVQARVIAPDLSDRTITLQPTAPERWEGSFSATQVGAYLLQVTWQGSSPNGSQSANRLTTTSGMVVPYSPEFRAQGTDTRFLKLLADAGEGTLLNPSNVKAAFTQPLNPVSSALPITFLLLALAALLLPLDVAARRLSSLEFLAIGLRWLIARLRGERPALATGAALPRESSVGAPLSTLRQKRDSRRQRRKTPDLAPSERLDAPPPTRTPRQQAPPPETREASTTEKLLEAKRKRQQEAGE